MKNNCDISQILVFPGAWGLPIWSLLLKSFIIYNSTLSVTWMRCHHAKKRKKTVPSIFKIDSPFFSSLPNSFIIYFPTCYIRISEITLNSNFPSACIAWKNTQLDLLMQKRYSSNKFQRLLSFPKTNVRSGFDLIASIFQVLAPLSEVKGAVK